MMGLFRTLIITDSALPTSGCEFQPRPCGGVLTFRGVWSLLWGAISLVLWAHVGALAVQHTRCCEP